MKTVNKNPLIFAIVCTGLASSLFPLLDRAANSVSGHPVRASCDTQTKSALSPDSAHYADIRDTLCDDLGSSYTISVSVRKKTAPSNNGDIVFTYEPGPFSGPLEVQWIDSDNLSISVDHIEYIYRQAGLTDAVFVHYKIGHVGDLYDKDEAKNKKQ